MSVLSSWESGRLPTVMGAGVTVAYDSPPDVPVSTLWCRARRADESSPWQVQVVGNTCPTCGAKATGALIHTDGVGEHEGRMVDLSEQPIALLEPCGHIVAAEEWKP